MALRLRWQTPLSEVAAREQLHQALGPAGLNLPQAEAPDPAAIAFRLDDLAVVAYVEPQPDGTAVRIETDAWDPRLLELEHWLIAPPPEAPPEAPFAGS